MKNVRNVLKWLVAFQLILFAAVSVSPAQNPVCFQQKNSDRIKIGCKKYKGKHDAFPRYECPESGKLMPFDPKDEWELLEGDDPLCKPEPTSKGEKDIPKGNGDDKTQTEKTPEKPASSESGKGDKQ